MNIPAEISHMKSELSHLTCPRGNPTTGEIYFLVSDKTNMGVVYVGQTQTGVRGRLRDHRKDKKFDTVFVMECPVDKLDETESDLISRLQPFYNKVGKDEPIRRDVDDDGLISFTPTKHILVGPQGWGVFDKFDPNNRCPITRLMGLVDLLGWKYTTERAVTSTYGDITHQNHRFYYK